MEKQKKNKVITYVVVIVCMVLLLDQITKLVILQQKETIEVIPQVLEFQKVANTGGAFGVGQNNTFMFIISNVVVLGLIIRFIWLQKERMERKMAVTLSIILAGGIGNLIDRLTKGFVIDFIRVFSDTNFPVFNIADICIVLGWVSLAFIFAKYSYEEIQNKKNQER